MEDKRGQQRAHPYIKNLEIEFSTKEGKTCRGKIQDVSKSGMFLWDCFTNGDDVLLKIQIGTKRPFLISGKVVRRNDKDPWLGIQFIEPLSEFHLLRIQHGDDKTYLPGSDKTFSLAMIDRQEVFRGTSQIKAVASNYFMWCIGSIIPFTIVIWVLVLTNNLNAESASSSMIGIIILFAASIFSNIEKARSINKREGFIAAIDYYIKDKHGPQNYRGWVNLKHCMGECAARNRAGICPINGKEEKLQTCIQTGMDQANRLHAKKSILPAILDSLISLTSFFYALIFLGLTILTIISFSKTWNALYKIPTWTTTTWFLVGLCLSFIILRSFYLMIGMILAVVVTITAGAMLTDLFLINISSVGIGIILGAIGGFFLKQLVLLRKGYYSFESFTHAWFEVFENCVFLPEEVDGKFNVEPFFQKLRRKIKSFFKHQNADYTDGLKS